MGASTLEKSKSRNSLDELLGQTSADGEGIELKEMPAPTQGAAEDNAGPSTEDKGDDPQSQEEETSEEPPTPQAEGSRSRAKGKQPMTYEQMMAEEDDVPVWPDYLSEISDFPKALQTITASGGSDGSTEAQEAALRFTKIVDLATYGPDDSTQMQPPAEEVSQEQTETPVPPAAEPAVAGPSGTQTLRQRRRSNLTVPTDRAATASASASGVLRPVPEQPDLERGDTNQNERREWRIQEMARRVFPWFRKQEPEPDLQSKVDEWWQEGGTIPKYKEQVQTDLDLQPALISRKQAQSFEQLKVDGYPGAKQIVILKKKKKKKETSNDSVYGKGKAPAEPVSDPDDSDDNHEFATVIVRDSRQVLVEFEPDMATMREGYVREEGGDFTQKVEWDHARNQWVSPAQRKANMVATGHAMQKMYVDIMSKTEHLPEKEELMLQLEQYVKATANNIHLLFKGEKTDTDITNDIMQHCRDIAKLNYDRKELKKSVRRHHIPTGFQMATMALTVFNSVFLAVRFGPDLFAQFSSQDSEA